MVPLISVLLVLCDPLACVFGVLHIICLTGSCNDTVCSFNPHLTHILSLSLSASNIPALHRPSPLWYCWIRKRNAQQQRCILIVELLFGFSSIRSCIRYQDPTVGNSPRCEWPRQQTHRQKKIESFYWNVKGEMCRIVRMRLKKIPRNQNFKILILYFINLCAYIQAYGARWQAVLLVLRKQYYKTTSALLQARQRCYHNIYCDTIRYNIVQYNTSVHYIRGRRRIYVCTTQW